MAIYSKRFNFVFLHVPKSAGISMRTALLASDNDAIEFDNHILASEIVAAIGASEFARAYKFAFVRNPWDRAVGLYHFILSDESHAAHQLTKDMSFPEYLEVYNEKSRSRQTDWTHDADRQLVDFIGRFETLQPDFKKVCQQIGLEGVELPHLNRSKHADYRSYYTRDMREAVARSRAFEVSEFRYEF